MSWSSTAPDGSQSVKNNESILQGNTAYTESKMQNDHYWNEDATNDGYHKKIEMPKQGSDPAITAGMDGLLYYLDNVGTEPFYRNSTGIMQLLGIRAMAVFNGSTGALAYGYNVADPISRTSTGVYTVTFTTALPNNDYLVLGNAIRNNSSASSELLFEMQASTSLSSVKSTTTLKVMTRSDGGTGHDALQAWFVCFGG